MKTKKNVHYHKRVGGRLICTMASREIEPGCTNLASAVSMQLRLLECFLRTHEDTVLPHTHTLPPFPFPSLAPSLHAFFLNTVLPHLSSLRPSLPGTAQTPNPTPYTLSPRPNTRNTPTPYNLRPNPSLHPQRMQATRCPQLVPAATAAGNSTTSPHLPLLSAASPPPRYAPVHWPSPAGSCRPVTARARTIRGNGFRV